jgi:hypothetical protein
MKDKEIHIPWLIAVAGVAKRSRLVVQFRLARKFLNIRMLRSYSLEK